jgi:hypothetical protein
MSLAISRLFVGKAQHAMLGCISPHNKGKGLAHATVQTLLAICLVHGIQERMANWMNCYGINPAHPYITTQQQLKLDFISQYGLLAWVVCVVLEIYYALLLFPDHLTLAEAQM